MHWNILSWWFFATQGANSSGQLGINSKCDSQKEPVEVPLSHTTLLPENIKQIAGGGSHTLILDVNGHVFCSGSNSKGQLGSPDGKLTFEQIDLLREFTVTQISCGWDFSCAITNNGKMFVWGNNNYTQLGLGKSITSTSIPSRVQLSIKLAVSFKQASCGLRHSAFLNEINNVLVAGSGSKGQLGISNNFNDENYMSIAKVNIIDDIKSVACGQHHTLALRSDGTVYSWGENKHGQLGLDPVCTRNSFVPCVAFIDSHIKEIHAGWTHSAALTEDGSVYTWGRSNFGQLGSQRLAPHKPEKLTGFNFKQISLGSEHSLAVTNNSELFAWGWNEHGSCVNDPQHVIPSPRQLFKNQTVKVAFACTGHSFAVVE